MFWYSAYFWISFFIIVIVTVLALIAISSIRQKRLARLMRLEISNQGNVRSRYQIRAEDASFAEEGGLEYQFMKDGARLPELALAGAAVPGETEPVQAVAPSPLPQDVPAVEAGPNRVQQASAFSGTLSNLLMSIGRLLPGRVGSMIGQAGSQLYRGQYKVEQAQYIANQAKGLSSTTSQPARTQGKSPAPISTPVQAISGIRWCETPPLQPGETMAFDLLIRSPWVKSPQNRIFRLISRSIEAGEASIVSEEGKVRIVGGFWAHHIYPRLLVICIALFLLSMVALLVNGYRLF